jgi:integrase
MITLHKRCDWRGGAVILMAGWYERLGIQLRAPADAPRTCDTRQPRSRSRRVLTPKQLQAPLGHSSITTTFNPYGHLLPGMDEALAKKMDGVGRAALVPGESLGTP